MANKGNIVRWITVKGRRIPIYEDGTMGGFMEGKGKIEKVGNDTSDPHKEEKIASAKKMVSNDEKNLEGLREQLEKHSNDEHTEEIKARIKKAEERLKESKKTLDDREGKGSKSLEDHSDIQRIAEEHVKKIWNGGAANRELYDAAEKWAEEHNFDKNKAKDAAFAAMNKKQMAEIKKREGRPDAVAVVSHKAKAPSKKEPVPETKEVLNARHAVRLEAQRPGGPNQKALETLQKEYDRAVEKARAEAKSIKVGDKDVAVNKTASTYQEREVKRLVGDKYGETWAERRIDSYSSSKLKQIAKDAGIKNISTMTDNELRKKLLAMWKRG